MSEESQEFDAQLKKEQELYSEMKWEKIQAIKEEERKERQTTIDEFTEEEKEDENN